MLGGIVSMDTYETHHSGGDGAGLVKHDGVDFAGRLQDFGSFDEQTELGAAPGTDQQRCGGC